MSASDAVCSHADVEMLRDAQLRDDEIEVFVVMATEGRCPTCHREELPEYQRRVEAMRGDDPAGAVGETATANDVICNLVDAREELSAELESMQCERDDWRAAALKLADAVGKDHGGWHSAERRDTCKACVALARVRSLDKEGHG